MVSPFFSPVFHEESRDRKSAREIGNCYVVKNKSKICKDHKDVNDM